MAVNGIGSFEAISPSFTESIKPKESAKGAIPFAEYLQGALDKTNSLIGESDRMSQEFAAGLTDNIHQVLIASEKAEIALQFTMQIRNKILDAYNEIMRMQI